MKKREDNVVGIEPSEEYCENLVHKDNVTYYNYECNQDVIKNHEFMIPYYDSKNVETWFDGTYEKKVVSSSSNKVIINPLLMVMLLVFIIIIILMLFFLKRGSKLK